MSDLTNSEKVALNELSEKSFNLHFDFLKKVLTVCVTALAILISISPMGYDVLLAYSLMLKILYSLALSMLSLGILGVGICLYGFVMEGRAQSDNQSRILLNRVFGHNIEKRDRKYWRRFYTICEKLGFFFLVSSVLGFTGYLILMIFN